MKRVLATLTALIISFQASAGDKIGNGGGLWSCQKDETFLGGMLVDLFEAREEFKYNVMPQPPGMDPMQVANLILKKLESDFPALLTDLRPHWNEVLDKKIFVNAKIIEIPDSLKRIEPLPTYCPNGKWSYLQVANFKDNGQLLIRKDIWESPNLLSLDKAALLWHEAVYRWLRMRDGDTTSSRARQIIGLLFSLESKERIERELQEILNGPLPTKTGLICVLDNSYTRTPYAGYGETEMIAKANAKLACQNGQMPQHCQSENMADCQDLGNGMGRWSCTITNNYTRRLFKAEGRSELEGRFNAQIACLKGERPENCPSRIMVDCEKLK